MEKNNTSEEKLNRIFNVTLMLLMAAVILFITVTNYTRAGDLRDRLLLLAAAGASLCGVASTILSANARIANFFFGIINVVIYGAVCFFKGNYGSGAINLLYFLPMQFIGLISWRRRGGGGKKQVNARRLDGEGRLLYSLLFLAGTVAAYFILCIVKADEGMTVAEVFLSPQGSLRTLRWVIVVDAIATVGNFIGQYLLSTARMEQWIFWIAVNVSSVIMWTLTALADVEAGVNASLAAVYVAKYFFYLINAVNGLRIWLKLSRK